MALPQLFKNMDNTVYFIMTSITLCTLEYHKAKLGGRNGAKLSFKIADKMVFSKVIIEILMILMIRKTFLYSGERGTWFWTNAQFLQRSRPNQQRCP